MPLIKSKSKKAFESNLKREMHEGKPLPQSLAIAYSVKRKAKKAAGGSVESGSKDMNMAEGGRIGPKHKLVKSQMNDSLSRPDYEEAITPGAREKKPQYKGIGHMPNYVEQREKALKELGDRDNKPVQDGRIKKAEGGAISAKTEKRPMPNDLHDDKLMESHNEAKKALLNSGWTDRPTERQAQANNGRMVKPIKQPRMVPSDAFSTRLRDEEADLEMSAKPGPYGEQPSRHDDEEGPDRQGPDNVDKAKPHSGPKAYAKGGKIEKSDYNKPMHEAIKHPNALSHDEMDLEDSESPSEDEGSANAHMRDEEGQNRQGPMHKKMPPHYLASRMYHDDEANEDHDEEMNAASFAEGGHIGESQDNYADDGEHDSIAAACMARRDRLHAEIDSGAHDLDEAAMMAEGGEVDLSINHDEEPNNEDQMSFQALKKENYNSSNLDVEQPEDSNLMGDSEEDESENKHDRISAIRSRMAKRQFGR